MSEGITTESSSSLEQQIQAERARYAKVCEQHDQALERQARRIEALQREHDAVVRERDNLRSAYERLVQELELFKRRLFIAKAERIDTRQLELDYADKLRELEAVAGTLDLGKREPSAEPLASAKDELNLTQFRGHPEMRHSARE